MIELDLCVVMTKAEFDTTNATCLVCESHHNYEPGQMVFNDEGHYINISEAACTFSKTTGCWKQVIMNEGIITKGNQDFDANGQPYTAANPAPDAE